MIMVAEEKCYNNTNSQERRHERQKRLFNKSTVYSIQALYKSAQE